MAKIISKTESAGAGCFVQAVGIVALFFFPVGTILGLILLVWGSQMSKKLICGNCGNMVDSRDVKICPVCKEVLQL